LGILRVCFEDLYLQRSLGTPNYRAACRGPGLAAGLAVPAGCRAAGGEQPRPLAEEPWLS